MRKRLTKTKKKTARTKYNEVCNTYQTTVLDPDFSLYYDEPTEGCIKPVIGQIPKDESNWS